MNDYVLLMYNDAPVGRARPGHQWSEYFSKLRQAGAFQGGSSIGAGICVSKAKVTNDITRHLAGFIRIRAVDLEAARDLVVGNPVYEAGGTVEIRELPKDD